MNSNDPFAQRLDGLSDANRAANGHIEELSNELKVVYAQLERAKVALNEIASWDEGESVNSSFDEPTSAIIARKALAELKKGES